MVKSFEFFSIQSYNKYFISEIFFFLVKSYSISLRLRLHRIMKKALFLRFLRSLLENVLSYGSKNLYKP